MGRNQFKSIYKKFLINMGDRFLYDEYGEVFTANLTSKMELSAKEGEVKPMNYVSKTPSQKLHLRRLRRLQIRH